METIATQKPRTAALAQSQTRSTKAHPHDARPRTSANEAARYLKRKIRGSNENSSSAVMGARSVMLFFQQTS